MSHSIALINVELENRGYPFELVQKENGLFLLVFNSQDGLRKYIPSPTITTLENTTVLDWVNFAQLFYEELYDLDLIKI